MPYNNEHFRNLLFFIRRNNFYNVRIELAFYSYYNINWTEGNIVEEINLILKSEEFNLKLSKFSNSK